MKFNINKFGAIYESYINGQFKQFKEQVKRYGKKQFMLDTMNHCDLAENVQLRIIKRAIEN